eukprot:gene8984-16120_t
MSMPQLNATLVFALCTMTISFSDKQLYKAEKAFELQPYPTESYFGYCFVHDDQISENQLSEAEKVSEKQLYEAEKAFKMYEALISVMEQEERTDPDLLSKSSARRRRIAQESGYSEERTNPDLLSKSSARRRRIAQEAGYSEVDVSNMMAKFTQMRSTMKTAGRMMSLGQANGTNDEALMKELVASSTKKVSEGKVRRKKVPADRSKGFGAKK